MSSLKTNGPCQEACTSSSDVVRMCFHPNPCKSNMFSLDVQDFAFDCLSTINLSWNLAQACCYQGAFQRPGICGVHLAGCCFLSRHCFFVAINNKPAANVYSCAHTQTQTKSASDTSTPAHPIISPHPNHPIPMHCHLNHPTST